MPTATFQPDDTVVADAELSKEAPTTNLSTGVSLRIGEDDDSVNTQVWRSVIKFDLSSIPAGSTINNATLTLTHLSSATVDADNTRTLRAYRLKRAWVESEVTWNQYSSGNNWGTAGAGDTTNDREATDVGSGTALITAVAGDTTVLTMDTDAISEMVDGTFTNNGWLLQMDTETNDKYEFGSSGNSTSSYRPKLVIDYTEPSSSSSRLTLMGVS